MVAANCFNYNRFSHSSLEQKAKATRSSFLGFVQHTFKKLVAQGSALWELQNELLTHLGKPEGKAAFEQWLDSDEFGASRYIARSAMEISQWYSTLPAKVQRLVMKNCHHWSVAALRELPKLAVNLVQELVSRPQKQTAKSVRDCAAQMSEEEWAAIAQHYGLSEIDLENVQEQARIFAIAETPENANTVIMRGHVMKALEQLGFRIGQQSQTATGFSTGGGKNRIRQVAIATYNLSEAAERKLTLLAKTQGVAPNEVINQWLENAPEFHSSENSDKSVTAPAVEEIEQKYLAQIAKLQNQLAATIAEMRNLQQQLAKKEGEGKEGEGEGKEEESIKNNPINAELLKATVEEIEAIPQTVWRNAYAPSAARNIDVRSALANVGESTLFLVQRLVKSLKKASAATSRDWNFEFAIDENQEIENWEPA